jgi:tetratricopeptide (TPR) repeat protein
MADMTYRLRIGLLCLCTAACVAGCSEPQEGASPEEDRSTPQQVPPPPESPAATKTDEPAPARPDATAIAANNRGVGLMGRFEYAAAEEVFAELAEHYPDWDEVRINLAIATLNRQEEGDEQAALAIADQVLEHDPANLQAHYVAGLLRLYLSSPKEALGHFRYVAEHDPRDAYAAYYLGQCLAQESQYEQAEVWYRKAIELDPYLRSAYYGAFQALQRLKQRDRARQVIQDYQRLAGNPRARLAEFKYTRMGPKAEARALDLAPAPEPAPIPQGPLFAAPRPLAIADAEAHPGRLRQPLSVTVADLQGDGHGDVFIPGLTGGDPCCNLLLMGDGKGGFESVSDHPLTGVDRVNAALWGDYDNDGLIDAYLCRKGPNQLWHQAAPGRWEEVSAASGTVGGDYDTRDGMFVDADHDGDLDLLLANADGPNQLLNNNLDGSFRDIAAQQDIAGRGGAVQVLAADLDADRDLDLVFLHPRPPHEVYVNDRLWNYRPAAGLDDFRDAPASAVLAGDLDADGRPEIYALSTPDRLLRFRPDAQGVWRTESFGLGTEPNAEAPAMALRDLDGDGTEELIYSTPDGWAVTRIRDEGLETLFEAALPKAAGWTPILLQPQRGPAMLGVSEDGQLRLWDAGEGRFEFLALVFSGMEDSGQSMRSNASGIGTRVAVRAGSRWSIHSAFDHCSTPGQGLQPLSIGLGGAPRADYAAIDWPDGVFQSELDLAPGKLDRIVETQRQLSSCPVLFAWDGSGYAFVSDLLGVGGLGYAIGRGEYATPRPWESFLLPEGLAKPRQGSYELKLAEPMEEALYLDAARLVAYDLPPGWDLVIDERMSILGPEPSGEPLFFRRQVQPSRVEARADDGPIRDRTAELAAVDGRAVPLGPKDRRFIGRLAGEQVLTLSFDTVLDAGRGQPVLIADGWVEYPYSQTMFAAWQAGADYRAPTLEARGADGHWQTLYPEFGYPAGMPRRMALPLQGLPTGTDALRLRSNMEIYWDRIAVAYAETPPQVVRQPLSLQRARVAKTGFALRSTGPQRRPHYDYQRRSPFWDAYYMAGFYTRLGAARELVETHDDALAIIGPGDEIHLESALPQQPTPPGWKRRLVLEVKGWAKDMDLYTKDGETLGPLPTSGKPRAIPERLHAAYNTRFQAGH